MKPDALTLVLLGLALLMILFLALRCSLSCKSDDKYTRTDFGQQSFMKRSQVDYASAPHMNPHYMANPESKYQPLEHSPVDFYADHRKLDNGTLWLQYDVSRPEPPSMYPRNSKTRFDLLDMGELDAFRDLSNVGYTQNVEEDPTMYRMHGDQKNRKLCFNAAGNYIGYDNNGVCLKQ